MPSTKQATDDASSEPMQDKILVVATTLFIRDGYNGISFLGIAKELGIGHSHIHYYFRTKSVLAEAVLRRYVAETKADFRAIWTTEGMDLLARLVGSRDWIHRRYLAFNPEGSGRQNWGLLARFANETDSLSPEIRGILRDTLNDMDAYVSTGIRQAVASGELRPDAPQRALVLQISLLLHTSRNLTRFDGNFQRLDDLLRWTFEVIQHAYGTGVSARTWPGVASDGQGAAP